MPEAFERELAVFSAARRLPAEERAAYLDQTCGDDAALRRRVEELLRAGEHAEGFLKDPAPGAQRPEGAAAAPAMVPDLAPPGEKAGDRIGHYKLLQQIGEGGCGLVYMAEQEEPVRRRVALKVIKLGMDTKSVIGRFEAERQALAMMDHPNIAKVFEAGATETGRPYFVMELVRGIKITDYCDEHNLSTRERLELFIQVCRAVQHAHQKGIIHRDLKPSNILVASDDGVPVPKVIDFGIAKATQGRLTDLTLFTAFEQFIGTPAYMSPEQAELTMQDVDTRTDIYSLGVLLYELLTGKTPFDAQQLLASGLDAMRRTIREVEPIKPSTRLTQDLNAQSEVRNPKPEKTIRVSSSASPALRRDERRLLQEVRGDLDWIAMKCLEKDRARRYATANSLANDVRRHLNCEPVTACPPSRLYEFQKTVRRHKFGFGAGLALIMVMAVGVLVSTLEAFRARRAEREQVHSRREAEAQRKKSQTEAAKSEQVAELLRKMIEGVGPSVALGRDTTMLREILDNTAATLGKALTNQPEAELELRCILANTYHELELYQPMETMARRSLQLARSLPGAQEEYVAFALSSLGDALMHLGDLDEAEKCTREALAMRDKLLGDEHRAEAVRSLSILGQILEKRGKLVEAETTFREALAAARQLPGDMDSNVAGALYDLANILEHQWKLPEAERLYREGLEIERKLYGDQHPEVAHSLNNLGKVLWQQGKLEEAETIFRQVLAVSRKLLGNEHPLVATGLNNLGRVLADSNKPAEAEPMLREALRLRRRLFGNDDPSLDSPLNNLARVLGDQEEWSESEALNRELLALRRKHLGNEHADVADTLEILASVLHKQGELAEADSARREAEGIRSKLAEAEKMQREALAIRRKLVGNEHPEIVVPLFHLATVLAEEGKVAEAEAAYREALFILGKSSTNPASQQDPRRALLLHHLAELLRKQKALPQARSLAEEAFALYQLHPDWPADERRHAFEVLTEVLEDLDNLAGLEALLRAELARLQRQATNAPAGDSSEIAVVSHHLAAVLRERKALVEARSLAEEAATLYRRYPDWPPDERAHALLVLAAVLTDLGEFSELEAIHRERLEVLRVLLPADDPELAIGVAELAATLLEEKKFAEAEPLARECLALRQKHRPGDWRTFNARSMLGAALLGQNKHGEETEQMLLTGYEGMKQREDKIPAEARVRLGEALKRLVQLSEATGRLDQAAEWKKKLDEFDQPAR